MATPDPRPIPREAVDAAARQIHTGFDTAAPIEQHNARETAMEALTAALPLLLAVELERIAPEVRKLATLPAVDRWDEGWQSAIALAVKDLTDRATDLRSEFRG